MERAPALRLYGKRGSPQAYAIRDFLYRSDVPFEWIELGSDEQARAELGLNSVNDSRLPICIFPDGIRMERPTVRQVTEKLGWFRHPSRSEYDVAIYGAGPAGLSASVYASSEGLRTVLVERFAVGGQASSSPNIENYLGFPDGISGAQLAERAREQAAKFGVEILIDRAGVRGEFSICKGVVELNDGTKLVSRVSVLPRVWSIDVWDYPARTGCLARASITVQAQAKPSFAATSMSSWWAPAIPRPKPRCTFPAMPAK